MITHQFASETFQNRLLVFGLLIAGVVYAGLQALQGDWIEVAFLSLAIAGMIVLASVPTVQRRVLREPFSRRHAVYIGFFWLYGIIWLNIVRALPGAPPTGKSSAYFYTLVIGVIALTLMILRSLAILTLRFARVFSTHIPLWEQVLVAINELIAAGALALFGANTLVRLVQPEVFTTRFDLPYTAGIGAVLVIYYVGMQVMWVQRWNDWLSTNAVWVGLARVLSPLALIVTTMVIAARFINRADPRSANLLGDAQVDLVVLALASVIWLVILVVMFLVYTGHSGLRQRFLPDVLLDHLPSGLGRFLRTISDMDMLLILSALATSIPAYLFLLRDTSGIIGTLRQQILQRGGGIIETSEQALALLFSMPFYALIVGLLLLYAYAISRASLSAPDREAMIQRLPIGFLIILIITLFLFAVPFSQVLTEGRLPRLPQDLGRILLFNGMIPLLLLYAHYFLLVRIPYGRGQTRWREAQTASLARQLESVERRIDTLNQSIERLDHQWHESHPTDSQLNMEMLYRYVQLNSMRDDTNMQRLQVLSERQQLTEISETPVSLAVARLPVRIVSIGIPLLLAIQIYQWAVLNNGLREIINNPNITVVEFFRAILQQTQF